MLTAYATVEGDRRHGVPDVLERDGAVARCWQAWNAGFSIPAVFHSETCKPRLPREPSGTASGSLDSNRVPSPELDSRRSSTQRNHELSAIAGLYYTSIDAPEDNSIVLSLIEATGDQVYVRFHGKNRENWFKHNIRAAERFKYLYSEQELQSPAKGSVIWSNSCVHYSEILIAVVENRVRTLDALLAAIVRAQ